MKPHPGSDPGPDPGRLTPLRSAASAVAGVEVPAGRGGEGEDKALLEVGMGVGVRIGVGWE